MNLDSLPAKTFRRALRQCGQLLIGMSFALLLVACGGSTSSAFDGVDTASTPEATSAESADNEGTKEEFEADAGSPGTTDPLAAMSTVDELWALVEETVALPRMSFELDVTSSLPGSEFPIVATRDGVFDDPSFSGFGTRSFETEEEALAEVWGSASFEFRFVDETMWMYNPLGDPPSWGGFNALELAESTGGDPLGSIDGDAYLALIAEATKEILDVETQIDGSEIWTLSVQSDDLVSVVAAGGPASRLMSLGAAESGLDAIVELEQDPEGYFVGFTSDLSEWWTNAIEVAGLGTGEETMFVEFSLGPFDGEFDPEAPCENPASSVGDDGLTILNCKAEA